MTTITSSTLAELGPSSVITASASMTRGKALTVSNSSTNSASAQRGP